MWREVPPGVSSFHPPSPSFSLLSPSPFLFLFLLLPSFFFISYERQSLLPNAEAPQELIIQKTRAPRRMKEQAMGKGRWGARRVCVCVCVSTERWEQRRGACVKVGRGCLRVCACAHECERVCACCSLLINVKSLSEPRGILHIP